MRRSVAFALLASALLAAAQPPPPGEQPPPTQQPTPTQQPLPTRPSAGPGQPSQTGADVLRPDLAAAPPVQPPTPPQCSAWEDSKIECTVACPEGEVSSAASLVGQSKQKTSWKATNQPNH